MDKISKPIFIGGTGRSGTTILSKVLGSHQKIHRLPETRFLIDPDGLIDLIPTLSTNWSLVRGNAAIYRFSTLMNEIGRHPTFWEKLFNKITKKINKLYKLITLRNYLLSPARPYITKTHLINDIGCSKYNYIFENYLNRLSYSEFNGYKMTTKSYEIKPIIISAKKFNEEEIVQISSSFVKTLFSQALSDKETHWVDDTPSNILHVNFLHKLFPEMKIIHIYRDPRDVISSFVTKFWGGNEPVDVVKGHRYKLEKWIELKKEIPNDIHFEIKLEDLIDNQESKLSEILNFIGLPFDESVLNIELSRERGHVGRWKKELSSQDIKLIRSELEDIMSKYGYDW